MPRSQEIVRANGQVVPKELFTDFVSEYPRGVLGIELAEALMDCVEATQLYGKQSSVNLKIVVGPGGGLEGELEVQTTVTTKPAKAQAPKVTFFATTDGGLSRRDPNQQQLKVEPTE